MDLNLFVHLTHHFIQNTSFADIKQKLSRKFFFPTITPFSEEMLGLSIFNKTLGEKV